MTSRKPPVTSKQSQGLTLLYTMILICGLFLIVFSIGKFRLEQTLGRLNFLPVVDVVLVACYLVDLPTSFKRAFPTPLFNPI